MIHMYIYIIFSCAYKCSQVISKFVHALNLVHTANKKVCKYFTSYKTIQKIKLGLLQQGQSIQTTLTQIAL